MQPLTGTAALLHTEDHLVLTVFVAPCTAGMGVQGSEKPHFSCSEAGTFALFPLSKTYPERGFPDQILTVPTKMWVSARNQECSLKSGCVPVVSPPSPPVFPHALNIKAAGASGNEATCAALGPLRPSWLVTAGEQDLKCH